MANPGRVSFCGNAGVSHVTSSPVSGVKHLSVAQAFYWSVSSLGVAETVIDP